MGEPTVETTTCPGCDLNAEPDVWCANCAPSWVRIARVVRELRALRVAGQGLSVAGAVLLAAERGLDRRQTTKALAQLDPAVPVMPRVGRWEPVKASRVGAAGPWRPEPRTSAERRVA